MSDPQQKVRPDLVVLFDPRGSVFSLYDEFEEGSYMVRGRCRRWS